MHLPLLVFLTPLPHPTPHIPTDQVLALTNPHAVARTIFSARQLSLDFPGRLWLQPHDLREGFWTVNGAIHMSGKEGGLGALTEETV